MHFYMHSNLHKKFYSCKKWVLQTHIKMMPLCTPSPITSALSPSNLLLLPFATRCAAPTSLSMASEADQTHDATNMPIADDGRSDSEAERDAPATSSCATLATIKIANKVIPDMSNYWKKLKVA
jgi:hypothetical protein